MPLFADQVASATRCPADDVAANWPLIQAALDERGIRTDLVEVAAAATIAVETARTFRPVHERLASAERQPELAARQAQYTPFTGRGFVQITWQRNYQDAGQALGLDLVSNPDAALDPGVSARILAWFFATHPTPEHNVATAANAGRWDLVRQRVNGGMNNWDEFKGFVDELLGVCGDRR